jgi:hypothetical protein
VLRGRNVSDFGLRVCHRYHLLPSGKTEEHNDRDRPQSLQRGNGLRPNEVDSIADMARVLHCFAGCSLKSVRA